MRIIEFCGLTGCGKSTACNEIISEYKKQYKVFTYRELLLILHMRKIYLFFVRLNPKRRKYIKALKDYASDYKDVSKNAIDVLIALFDMSCLFGGIFRKGIAILDEGFVQTLTSIAHLQTIDNRDKLQGVVNAIKDKHDIYIINCEVEVDTAVERIRKRNGPDRFNQIKDDSELAEALRIKQSNIDIVRTSFGDNISICMDQDREKIVESIKNRLSEDGRMV